MLTKEEIEKIAKQKYPEKWESHYPKHIADDGTYKFDEVCEFY